ncbi:MucB/RseB C-terminal domain-containing protein [Mangrovitalea sediminis]|uniref:MucB/RseB C-terminal domain-containing protein n=1 Tax=Mangrovitalea sediminis TaxID=1982043 RepID=UPI001D0D2B84|nr:MucB/RseB C-terminal domain-containing protein [Mangrovitalea sediminis]
MSERSGIMGCAERAVPLCCRSRSGEWLLCLLLFWSSLAAAEQPSKTAEQWLQQLAPALNRTSYKGVFVYTRGNDVNSMRIYHRYRDGHVRERLVQLDGANGEIIRDDNRVVCIYPNKGQVQLDNVIPAGPFAEAFANQLTPVTRWYTPTLLREDRIAGYPAVGIELKAKDKDRYSYRLWLEKNTGLLVRSEVVGVRGHTLERFQFTDLTFTDNIPDSELEAKPGNRTIQREDIRQPDASPHRTEWSMGWKPAGFVAAAAPVSARNEAVAYSDGLASFSVFVEPLKGVDMPSGVSRIGATTAYLRKIRRNNTTFLITVVGEVPPLTARRVANGIELGH